MSRLEKIIAEGNRGHHYGMGVPGTIYCKDGFTVSVIAGNGMYCLPRPVFCGCFEGGGSPMPLDNEAPHDYAGPYSQVEVGFPSRRPEPWDEVWAEFAEDPNAPTQTVYGYVPVEIVRDLVSRHGGEME